MCGGPHYVNCEHLPKTWVPNAETFRFLSGTRVQRTETAYYYDPERMEHAEATTTKLKTPIVHKVYVHLRLCPKCTKEMKTVLEMEEK